MATNYQRGYSKERQVIAYLELKGYFVVRSGASKGPVDLVATFNKVATLLQVKSTHNSTDPMKIINRPSLRAKLKEFEELRETYGHKIVVIVQVINRKSILTFFLYDAGVYSLTRI